MKTISDRRSNAEKVAGKHWEIDGASGQVTRRSTLPISLNAIAKGYILDHVAQLAMKQVEVSGVLVDTGGDIRAAGILVASISIADPCQRYPLDLLLEASSRLGSRNGNCRLVGNLGVLLGR